LANGRPGSADAQTGYTPQVRSLTRAGQVWEDGGKPSSVQLIRASNLSDVAEYAYAATAPKDARLVFLAGSCPLNDDGSTAAIGDYAGQAAACVDTMTRALGAAGATIQDVISTRVLVASSSQADLVAAWEVVRDAFGDHDVPSTLMGVTVLGYDDQLVELEAVAAVID
jgi:enamine deaminase RidA (YjgF/YER057c/UK114 family)